MLGPNRNFNLAIRRAKLRGSAKVAFSVADSEIRWAELVPSRTVLTLSVQNGPACSKSALDKLGPIWPLGSIWLFSFYSVPIPPELIIIPHFGIFASHSFVYRLSFLKSQVFE